LFLLATLLLTVYGQLVVKARALLHAGAPSPYLLLMFTDIWVLSGLGAAVAAGCFWMLAVRQSDLGYAYPFMALSFALVPIGASVLFGERLPLIQLAGLALIVAGVTLSALAR
jgi:multidrug transporter EmrE-like cation transporter